MGAMLLLAADAPATLGGLPMASTPNLGGDGIRLSPYLSVEEEANRPAPYRSLGEYLPPAITDGGRLLLLVLALLLPLLVLLLKRGLPPLLPTSGTAVKVLLLLPLLFDLTDWCRGWHVSE
jgi:hypothetical protein